MNGEWVLGKASCKKYNKITSSFEKNVLRNLFGYARAAMKLRTRRKHPEKFTIVFNKDNKKTEMEVPAKEYGAVVYFPEFLPPAYFDKRIYKEGVNVKGFCLNRAGGIPLEEIAKKYGFKEFAFKHTFNPVDFARFLAKVAYGFSILKFGKDSFQEAYVLPDILGRTSKIGMWVGSVGVEKGNEGTKIKLEVNNKEVVVLIRLFAKWNVPTYQVVVGRLK